MGRHEQAQCSCVSARLAQLRAPWHPRAGTSTTRMVSHERFLASPWSHVHGRSHNQRDHVPVASAVAVRRQSPTDDCCRLAAPHVHDACSNHVSDGLRAGERGTRSGALAGQWRSGRCLRATSAQRQQPPQGSPMRPATSRVITSFQPSGARQGCRRAAAV